MSDDGLFWVSFSSTLLRIAVGGHKAKMHTVYGNVYAMSVYRI